MPDESKYVAHVNSAYVLKIEPAGLLTVKLQKQSSDLDHCLR
jgi:hypothetical protein